MRPGPPTTGPGFLTPKTSTETIPARVPWGPTERSRGRRPPRLLCRLAHGVTAPRGDCARAPEGITCSIVPANLSRRPDSHPATKQGDAAGPPVPALTAPDAFRATASKAARAWS